MSGARVAVVGMACVYPDARSPEALWENVLAKRRAFRRIPEERLSSRDYYSAERTAPDRTYAFRAAVIEGWEFDRVAFRVAGPSYRSADLAHWLALDVASSALGDAGFADGNDLPKDTTGVLVGNSLTGEFSRASLMRLRWPYVRRVVDRDLEREGWDATRRAAFLVRLESSYKAPFAPVGEESLAGGLSNTIAGRICNTYDLHGGGYTVDGACSSSLLAIAHAAGALVAGDLDVALAGGVDLSLDPFELVGFAKTGALAEDDMRVYDERSAGFWPGEGCGMVVLMREEDARARSKRVYATLEGWGISSDGSGGITRPEAEGQLLALRRAYRRAGYGADSVGYFEGHGTGTAVGDATELRVLVTARREAGARTIAALGSVKANIGHTKAAAGVAGFIKAVKALETQVIPPASGVTSPHPVLSDERPSVLELPQDARPWRDPLRRASVSSMGFGGINVHVTLESDEPPRAPSPRVRSLVSSSQDAELVLIGERDRGALVATLASLGSVAPRLSLSELSDLATSLARRSSPALVRAAVVARTPDELLDGIVRLRAELESGERTVIDPVAGVFLGSGTRAPRIGFLFPGQGSPSYRGGGAMRRRFGLAADVYRRTERFDADGDERFTAVAQPSIVRASIAACGVLESMGVRASIALGHSLGELTALAWAGVFDEEALVGTAFARGRAMGELAGPGGAMASLGTGVARARELIGANDAVVAGLNTPSNTVVAGPSGAIERIVARARAAGVRASRLAVSHAFHSPQMRPAASALESHLRAQRIGEHRRTVVSTVTGDVLGPEEDVSTLLMRQLTEPVRFHEAVCRLRDVDLLVEVGPGSVLSAMAAELVDVPIVATDAGGPSLAGLLRAIGAAWASGAPIERGALADGRFARPFDPDRRPRFFENPCESVPALDTEILEVGSTRAADAREGSRQKATAADPRALVRALVAERAELPADAIEDDHHVLEDLHLNSITVGQIVVEVAKRTGMAPPAAPNEFASATVREIGDALAALAEDPARALSSPDRRDPDDVPGVAAWVRPFGVVWREEVLPSGTMGEPGCWRLVAARGDALAEGLRARSNAWPGRGVALVVPDLEPGRSESERALARAVLDTITAIGEHEAERLLLVERRASAAAFARSVRDELRGLDVLIVTVPPGTEEAVRCVESEIAAARSGYVEVRHDGSHRRRVPILELLEPREGRPSRGAVPPAGQAILVTGGGKGIAAESALALSKIAGASLVLMGRSDPSTDPELASNLERMRAVGARHLYLRADVTDRAAVRAAISRAKAELGPITGIVHGAGVNVPLAVGALDARALEQTLAPKLDGLRNVMDSIDTSRLSLLVTFGSIIARAGMRGESHYALANDLLGSLTERFASELPGCRCLCIEWSAWSGAGMAERLGRVDALLARGVTPISPDAGVEALRALVASATSPVRVVVTGRFGATDTLAFERVDLPLARFLERTRVFVPGVELVVEAELSPETDPYLDDHVMAGDRLLPAVMGLEAMAQVAGALTGRSGTPRFENVRFRRPITVSGDRLTIRIAALSIARDEVTLSVRSEETGFAVEHFSARCRFGAPVEPVESVPGGEGGAVPLDLDPAAALYGSLLFQRGRFERVDRYTRLGARALSATMAPDGRLTWFGAYLPDRLALGDPGARDACLHAIQASVPHARIIPLAVDSIDAGVLPTDSALEVRATERRRDGDAFVYDVDIVGPGGAVIERWRALSLKAVGPHRMAEWPPALVEPYVERRLEELLPESGIAVRVTSGAPSRETSAALAREAAGAPVHRRSDGKPVTTGDTNVSISHAGGLIVATASRRAIGCDLEPVAARDEATWRGLLGRRFELAVAVAETAAEEPDTSRTRVWCAMECLAKLGAPPTAPLVVSTRHADGWVMLASGSVSVATCALRSCGTSETLVLSVATSETP